MIAPLLIASQIVVASEGVAHGKPFPDDYVEARRRFANAARKDGARLHSVSHPTLRTPTNEGLAIDVARIGDRRARRAILVTSGLHGLEGPAGSAIQSTSLEQIGPQPWFPDVAVCLVHALNPWGFAWVSRLTADNVVLNQNFID